MPIFRTFSAASRRPFFTPPVTGVNESNYWQKIDQAPAPLGGEYALWMNPDITDICVSGVDTGSQFFLKPGFYKKEFGQWVQYDPLTPLLVSGTSNIGGEPTAKNQMRSVGTRNLFQGGIEFTVVQKNNSGIFEIAAAFNGNQAYIDPKHTISSNGNAILHIAQVSPYNLRDTYLMKFQNSQWVQKLFFYTGNAQFPTYNYSVPVLNSDGSRFGIVGTSSFSGTCVAKIFQETANQNGTSTYSQIGSQITLQTAGILTNAYLNDEGNRIAVQISANTSYNVFSVEVWEFNGTSWVMLGSPIQSNTALNSILRGRWFSYDGTTVFVRQGYGIRALRYNGSAWVQIGATINGPSLGNYGKRVWTNDNGTKLFISGGASPSEGVAELYQYIS